MSRDLARKVAAMLANDLRTLITAYVPAVESKDGFVHKTQYPVACKILQLQTAVVAVPAELVTVEMAEHSALISPLPHVEVKEVEAEAVGYSIHIHKEYHPSSSQWIGHIDLPENERAVEAEVGVEVPEEQMQLVID